MTITVMVPPDPRGGARGRAMRVMLLLLLLLPSDGMKIIMAVPVVNGERIYMYAYMEATKHYVFIDFVSFELCFFQSSYFETFKNEFINTFF